MQTDQPSNQNRPSDTAIGVAGQVAGGVVEGLKTQPACLALVALVALIAVLAYYQNTGQRAEMHVRQMALIDRCYVARDYGGPPERK